MFNTESMIYNVFACVSLCLLSTTTAASPCSKVGMGLDWMGDSDDCSKFYICAFGMAIPLSCGSQLSWQPQKKVCCLKGSDMDTCTIQKEAKAKLIPQVETFSGLIEEPKSCQPGMTKKLPHPDNCARYYDCAATGKLRELSGEYERECPYLQLFNPATKKCDSYKNVECGQKAVPLDPCEYRMNQCTRAHCRPCTVRFPSCAGLQDGLQGWKGKEMTKFYCECKDQRVVEQRECPTVYNKVQIFDVKIRKCVDPETVFK